MNLLSLYLLHEGSPFGLFVEPGAETPLPDPGGDGADPNADAGADPDPDEDDVDLDDDTLYGDPPDWVATLDTHRLQKKHLLDPEFRPRIQPLLNRLRDLKLKGAENETKMETRERKLLEDRVAFEKEQQTERARWRQVTERLSKGTGAKATQQGAKGTPVAKGAGGKAADTEENVWADIRKQLDEEDATETKAARIASETATNQRLDKAWGEISKLHKDAAAIYPKVSAFILGLEDEVMRAPEFYARLGNALFRHEHGDKLAEIVTKLGPHLITDEMLSDKPADVVKVVLDFALATKRITPRRVDPTTSAIRSAQARSGAQVKPPGAQESRTDYESFLKLSPEDQESLMENPEIRAMVQKALGFV